MRSPIEIYNSTNYEKAPYPSVSVMYGARVVKEFGHPDAFIGNEPWDIDWGAFEKYLTDLPARPIICDIEHWQLNDSDSVVFQDSVMMYRAVLKFMKKIRPDVPIGNYSAWPVHAREVKTLKAPQSGDVQHWKARCDATESLTDYVDWLTPSIYWSDRSESKARRYAETILTTANKLRWQGKKVVPFIMPRAEEEGPEGRPIGEKYFNDWLCDCVYPYVDGVILWDYGRYKGPYPQWLVDMI